MFGLSAALAGPLFGGIALALFLGLGASVLHTTGLPFLGLKGLNGQLSDAQKDLKSCRSDINDPTTGWAVRYKGAQDNETRLKNSLAEIDAMTKADKAESDRRDAEASARLLALRQQNAGLDRQIRQIRAQVPMGAAGDIARQAEGIVLGSLQP